jgi:ribose-phosphate pyrophosphokinase
VDPHLKIFSGSSNPTLAMSIAKELDLELGSISIERFSDSEIGLKYNENIRGADVFVIQPTNSPSDNIIELLLAIDAAKRASARRITAVIPYYGYARQDRKDQPRVPISAKLLANLFVGAGADRILTMDLHVSQIQGFFDIPMDHLYGAYVFTEYYQQKAIPDLVVSSPDIGGVRMARAYAKRLGTGLALVDKRRPKPNDMVDTGGTLAAAARAMREYGAREIYAACSHALLSGRAVEQMMDSPIKELAVTDSVEIPEPKRFPNLKILSVAPLFAQAIDRIHHEKSISILFDIDKQ